MTIGGFSMKNFGKTFRSMRRAKKLSLKDIADGSISFSFLSKFERGKSDISLTNFYTLINKMNITIEEFSYVANDFNVLAFEKLLEKINRAYKSNNITLLSQYMEQENALWKDTENKANRLNAIMIHSLIYNLDSTKEVPVHDKLDLSEYLLSVDNWGYYEIVLFGNAMGALTLDLNIILSKELLNKSKSYTKLKNSRNEIIRILLNTITFCLESGSQADALYFINTLEDYLKNSLFYFEKTKLIFLIGIYKIKAGDCEDGIKKCRKAIQIMNDMGSTELAINHENYLEDLLKKQDHSIYDREN